MDRNVSTVVITGDSIAADITPSVLNEAASRDSHNLRFERTPSTESITLINTAIGGHTVEMIESRFERDCVSFNPGIAVINGGTNDLWGWGTSDTEFERGWTSILKMCESNGIIALALGIVPATGFPDDIMHKRDRWNTRLPVEGSRYLSC